MKQIFLVQLLVVFVTSAYAAAQEPRRIRVAVTSPGMTNLSLYVAERRGFFRRLACNPKSRRRS